MPLSSWTSWQSNFFYRSALQRTKLTKIIRVGISRDPLAPFLFYDEKTNDAEGIDIRVIKRLCLLLARRWGIPSLRIEYKPNTWLEGNAADLKNGETDVAIGEMSILSSREQTKPYWHEKMALVTLREHPIKSLKEARLTSWLGTTYEQVAKELARSYEPSNTLPEMHAKLARGDVQGFIDGAEIVIHLTSAEARAKLDIHVLEADELPEEFRKQTSYPVPDGLYVNQEQTELLEELNQVLASTEGESELKQIASSFAQARSP
jgi:ABC-type amino acid transport substrate-binding protein